MARRTAAEIKEMVIEAATDLVHEEGLGLGTEGITYARVFDHLEKTTGQRITRASVHERIWSDQAEFQRDLRVHLAGYLPTPPIEETRRLVREILARELESKSRRQVAREMVLSLADIDDAVEERDDRAHATVRGLMMSATPEELERNPELTGALVASVMGQADLLQNVLREIIDGLRMRLRADFGVTERQALRLVARSLRAVVDGVNLRAPFDPEALSGIAITIDRHEGSWNLPGIAGWSLLEYFFEFVEDD